jgi:hypothetical protein
MTRSHLFAAAILAALPVFVAAQSQDKQVHLNQIQVIGTHNSYNTGFAPSEEVYFKATYPKGFSGIDYHHQSLPDQLSAGARQLELDIVQDPKGGRFSHPAIVELTKEKGLPADPDFDPHHEFDKPGFKVIHLGDLNQRSSCARFVTCLQDIRTWSKSHPKHVPIFILVEDKQGKISQMPNAVTAEPWTPETWNALDAEILSVFPKKEIVTPESVRGKFPTLEAAVLAGNWPTLAKSRGKIVFLLYNRKPAKDYVAARPALKDRVLFINSDPGQPDAAFVERDNGKPEVIDDLVKKGYLVRTRSDFNTVAGRTNDTTRRDLLLTGGAQMISTDFPVSEPAPWTGYTVGLPAGVPARCNPVNAPATCKDAALEPGVTTKLPSPSHKPE